METIRFAILLYPVERSGWRARVICEQGPTALLPTQTYNDTYEKAEWALDDMFRFLSGVRAEVWTIHTTADAVDALDNPGNSLAATFDEIARLPRDGVTVRHHTVGLPTRH